MAVFTRQLECLNCSHTRSFVHHTETSQRMLTQAESLRLPRGATVTCGRCGSASVLQGWGDDAPYASRGFVPRQRQAPASARANAQASTSEQSRGAAMH
jgi:hypothetical protein